MEQFSLFAPGPKGPDMAAIKAWIDENPSQFSDYWRAYPAENMFGLDTRIISCLSSFDPLKDWDAFSTYYDNLNI